METKQFIRIIVYTSLVHMPNLPFEPIKSTLSLNRFEKIRQFIHFNNNENLIRFSQPAYDRLQNTRPINYENFCSVPLE